MNIHFSGGGARGYAYVGVLKELRKNGIDWGNKCPPPKHISGVSIGALFAFMIAIGYNAVEIEDIMRSVSIKKMVSLDPFRVIEKKISLDNGNTLRAFLETILEKKFLSHTLKLEDLNLSFFAVDVEKHCLCELKKGFVIQALMASMAIPPLFEPVCIDGSFYADGGILNSFPIHRLPKDTIGFKLEQPFQTMKQIMNQKYPIIEYMNHIIKLNSKIGNVFLDSLEEGYKIVRIPIDVSVLDFDADPLPIIEMGVKAVQENIPIFKKEDL